MTNRTKLTEFDMDSYDMAGTNMASYYIEISSTLLPSPLSI